MSGLLFHDPKPAVAPDAAALPQTGIATGFWENMRAGFRDQMLSSNFISRDKNLFNAYEPIVQALTDERGLRQFQNPYAPHSYPLSARLDPEAQVARIWKEIARRRKEDPQAAAGLPGSREALEDQVREQVLAARRDFESISERSTTGGAIGGFLGATGAAMLDPPVLATLAIGAPASAGLLRTVLVESLIGAGTEAGIQPAVADYYGELGIDYTGQDFLANVALGAAAGGVFAGGVKAAEAVVKRALQKQAAGEELTAAEAAEAASAVAAVPEERLPELAAAAGVAQAADQADAARTLDAVSGYEHPLPPAAGQAERHAHARKVEQAEAALETGPGAGAELPSAEIPPRYSPVPSTLEALDPLSIETDAGTFQFKGGGDASGVTDRLQGVQRWDPVKAGIAVVYEYADGRRVIADGHQRLGLARRLAASGQADGVRLNAHVIREADGVTPDEARVMAAVKNIAEGSGSPVDAARIFRARPDQIDASLPRRSALVQHGMALANLNDEAFGLVANGIVREDFGALVGRLAPDEDALQTGLMRMLAQEAPANQTEAEAMIRQFTELRGDDAAIADLFGAQTFATSLIRERARVLSRGIKALRNDKRVFETLTRNADEIEAAGNRLAEGNAQVAEVAAQAADIIMRLANRTGPVAEALNAAARKAKEQGRYGDAVRDFTEAVRSAVARGDLEGLGAGGTGRTLADEAAAADIPLFAGGGAGGSPARGAAGADTPGNLTGFGEPAGAASQAQSDGLAIDLGEVDDGLEVDLFAGTDDAGNAVTERLTKSAVLERQAAEADFLDQLKVVCRTPSGRSAA